MVMLNKINRLQATDVNGQKLVEFGPIESDMSIGEMIDGLLPQMRLQREDSSGRPLEYWARLDRESRHLHRTEKVGDALLESDRIVLQPNVDAGRGD